MRLGTSHLFSVSLLLSAVLIGCTPKEDDGFGSGGTDNNPTNTLPCDDCDTAELDTATTGTTDTETTETTDNGWPEPEDNGGPSQLEPNCYFEDFPNIGWNVVCEVAVYDAEGNLYGGQLELLISGGDFGDGVSLEGDAKKIQSLEADGACTVCMEGDDTDVDVGALITFAIPISNSSDNFDLVWTLKDKGGNESNEVEARVD